MSYQRSTSRWGADPDSLTRRDRPSSSPPPSRTAARETITYQTVEPPGSKRGYTIWLALGCLGLVICCACAVVAVTLAFFLTRTNPVPQIALQQPVGDPQGQVGQPMVIRASAQDSAGVTRVELWVDGTLDTEFTSDSPGGQKILLVEHPWVPAAAGTHNISLTAYNVSGQASEPVSFAVSVQELTIPVTTPRPDPTATPPPVKQAMATATVAPTDTPTPAPSPTPTVFDCTDDAAFVADVTVPDNTVFQPGAPIEKTWRIRNSGTCPWQSGYSLAFVSGNQMGGPGSQPVAATEAEGTTDVTVSMQAPSSYGTHTGVWRMANAAGEAFGQQLTVVIQVPSPDTPTPEPTPTSSGPGINISVDRDQLGTGECTVLHATVEGVTAAWLDGEPIAGGSRDKEVCPCGDTVYVLEAELPGGERITKNVTVFMEGGCNKPDLVIRDFYVKDGDGDIEKGDKITVRLRIKNQGSATAKDFDTSWWPFGTDEEERLDFHVDELDAGEDYDFNWEDIKYDRDGEFDVYAKVDYRNTVDESNEDNNTAEFELEVKD